MKIFDCFMYFDEDLVLDLRLNTLNQYVDYFIIVESKFNHKGEKRDLKFNIKNFQKYNKKIIYLIYDEISDKIKDIKINDNEEEKSKKYILNAYHRENGQRNFISKGLDGAADKDVILISDVDEIPNLQNVNFNQIDEKFIFFKQEMFYYKFNLKLPNFIWVGTKCCRKKNLHSPQWLRNIKDRKYPMYRLDTLLSKTKYIDIKFIDNGGWHFTNMKTPKQLKHKLESYLHHREFDMSPLSEKNIQKIVNEKKAIYNLCVDQRTAKIGDGNKLSKYNTNKLPEYLQNNLEKFKEWMD